MMHRLALPVAAAAFAASVALAHGPQAAAPAAPAPKQDYAWPERIANAKVLPADIGAERLRQTMVGFSRARGARCTHCHVGAEGAPLASLDFASDANPHKDIARGMMRMTARINGELLPAVQGVEQAKVTCFTCHRGAKEPALAPPPPAGGAAPPARPHAH